MRPPYKNFTCLLDSCPPLCYFSRRPAPAGHRFGRAVAQTGSAFAWGAKGRWFKSSRPDQLFLKLFADFQSANFFALSLKYRLKPYNSAPRLQTFLQTFPPLKTSKDKAILVMRSNPGTATSPTLLPCLQGVQTRYADFPICGIDKNAFSYLHFCLRPLLVSPVGIRPVFAPLLRSRA